MESWYAKHLLPHLLDCACGLAPITRQRQRLLPRAGGDVLEVGLGTGLNLPHYDVAKVRTLTGVEPSMQMHRRAQQRAERAGLAVRLVGLSAEKLPLPDACFDTIVCTWTLCSIPDPVSALREMRRVLRPEGRLLFSEHGRAPDESVQRWQRRVQPVWGRLFGGCQLGRDIPSLLERGGFRAPALQCGYLDGPRIATYNYWGEAVPA